MRRLAARILAAALLAAAAAPVAAPAAGLDDTRRALAAPMRSAGSASGALAVDLDSGRRIYSLRAGAARVPASVQKLYTTAAALRRFGPEGRLETQVLAEAPMLPDGVLSGDLYLRGGGDPALDADALEALAGDLVAAGLVEVTGRVVADESRFDARRGGPESNWRTSPWVGPLSALTYRQGRWKPSPALAAAEAFARALRRQGVAVRVRPVSGRTPAFATQLGAWQSPTMAQLSLQTNAPSDNFAAEMLLKALGARFAGAGTTTAGARVVRGEMRRVGFAPRVADGSGLSRSNRTSPRQVVRLLRVMAGSTELYAPFRGSLAVAGRTGTLHDRMRRSAARGRCRGKTGSLIGVSALAGFCETRGGALVAFAFLMNRVDVHGARTLQDRMVGALARYSP